jgi:hypothetical protein
MNINATIAEINRIKCRSAWNKGIKIYAVMLLENLKENGYKGRDITSPAILRKSLLNGAADWETFSRGGCALAYNGAIVKTLCTPEIIERYNSGKLNISTDEVFDCQRQALTQAEKLIINSTDF